MIGLNINIKKSEVMPLNTSEHPVIYLNGPPLDCTSSFTYLGSIVISEGGAGKDIRSRIGKARTAFLKLRHIRTSRNISKITKIRLYITVEQLCTRSAAIWVTMVENDRKRHQQALQFSQRLP